VKVCFAGARRLGLDCLKWLIDQPNVDVAYGYVPEAGWWTDCDDRAELAALGIPLLAPNYFAATRPDLVVSVLADYIFKPCDLAAYPAVNLHPAPLPEYRGCNSYAHAIQNGDSVYAVTLHYIDAGVDTGPIIRKRGLSITPEDTGRSLYDRARGTAFRMFVEAMPDVLEHHRAGRRYPAYQQPEGRARYFSRTSLQDKRTHPDDGVRIRALTFPPHPAPTLTREVPVGHGR
jgi:methionyl-tRNA formyltransferase